MPEEKRGDPIISTTNRNFEYVYFGEYRIGTWYPSPYPPNDADLDEIPPTSALAKSMISFASRTAGRSHTSTSDLIVRTMKPQGGDLPSLWVCDRCFKYFSEPVSSEIHRKRCTVACPPGKRVYGRDPLSIWEVDGAQEKLYCQMLSLFGKLFIDIKTIFFDLDNCYELSRRAGKVGTPERPLSALGLRGYLSYWVATLIRFFRRVLSVLPPTTKSIVISTGNFPDATRVTPDPVPRKKKNNDADLHAEIATLKTPLDLMTEDAAFALNEVGLLTKRLKSEDDSDEEGEDGEFIITRSLVERVAAERKIKRMVLDLNCVLLPE
ncbi:hypothetical protein H1R20_g14716, partial [Candolleomyces eurysporus]|uniref:MYST-type HAT domain-containing protein n=2 Tax=Candolleomyces TaxID=2791032 RepID=A0A4Q2D7Y4_9AGAR